MTQYERIRLGLIIVQILITASCTLYVVNLNNANKQQKCEVATK